MLDKRKRKRPRRVIVAPPGEFVTGWRFALPMPAFADALDIALTPRIEKSKGRDGKAHTETTYHWTRGEPPAYAFHQGDTFHAPADSRDTPWGDPAREELIQVQACDGDRLEIAIYKFARGEIGSRTDRTITQGELMRVLRDGLGK